MAGSVNKVILIGNLGKDPEVRSMQNGDEVVTFSVATSESWKDKKSGERQERTQWHNVVVFNQNIVSIVKEYVKKGSKLYVEGQLETRKWTDRDGNDKYTTEVVLRPYRGEINILGGKSASESAAGQSSDRRHEQSSGNKASTSVAHDDYEDEIPF